MENNSLFKILFLFILFNIGLKLLAFFIKYSKAKHINKKIKELASNSIELSPEDYLKLRNKKLSGERSRHANTQNFKGVYILHNKDKDLFYVGQSVKVLDRIGNHFSGRGNGDVYADYKYGDTFTIRTIALDNSQFDSLNDLERYAIRSFNAFNKGYNKNRGNK